MQVSQFRNTDAPKREHKTIITFSMEILEDEYPDLSWLEQDYDEYSPEDAEKYREQDRERLQAYNLGHWYMTGIRAKATISVPIGCGSFCTYTLESAGLWGVESDCGDEYRQGIYEEQKAGLIRAMRMISLAANELPLK